MSNRKHTNSKMKNSNVKNGKNNKPKNTNVKKVEKENIVVEKLTPANDIVVSKNNTTQNDALTETTTNSGFFKRNKAKILKFSLVLVLVTGFSSGCFFLFQSLGLLDKERLSETLADKGIWIYVIYIGLFVVQAVCLCVIPGNTTLFIGVGWLLFDNLWVVLLLSVIGVWLSGIALFWVGRFGGRKVLYWLFGEEAVEKQLGKVTNKGTVLLPALFLVPFMPNDMLCLVCGASKLKFWAFLLIIIPCRIIEVLIILSYPYIGKFFIEGREIQDVIIFINILLVDIVIFILYYRSLIVLFRKTILRKKYVKVEAPYTVEVEVKKQKKK